MVDCCISKEKNINWTVRAFRETAQDKDFKEIYEYCLPDFKFWYRNVQRYTGLDRATLLCEFQYILLKALRVYDVDCDLPDGFIRYFRAAARIHAFTLRREVAGTPKLHKLKDDWDVVDPSSLRATDYVDTVELINSALTGNEKQMTLMRVAGYTISEIKDQLKLTDFRYRAIIHNVKSNNRLERALLT